MKLKDGQITFKREQHNFHEVRYKPLLTTPEMDALYPRPDPLMSHSRKNLSKEIMGMVNAEFAKTNYYARIALKKKER